MKAVTDELIRASCGPDCFNCKGKAVYKCALAFWCNRRRDAANHLGSVVILVLSHQEPVLQSLHVDELCAGLGRLPFPDTRYLYVSATNAAAEPHGRW